jgi:hypothetical protein
VSDTSPTDSSSASCTPTPPGATASCRCATRRLHRELDLFRGIVDRWELANRREIFSWVTEEGLPLVATVAA